MSVHRILPVICFLVLAVGCRQDSPPLAPVVVSDVPTGTVTVEIVAEDGAESIQLDDVAVGTTVEEIMRSIDEIPIEMTGTGVNAFVHSIDGKATSGSEGWTYTVDGEYATEGVGSTKLDPPATITWSFGGM